MNRETRIRTLLVEPCPTTRASLATTLARCGCDVTAAGHDEEAYEWHVAGEYALAVVGVDRIPDQGFWLCRRLRSAPGRGEPVILALSDCWDAGRLAWLLEAGVDDCLTTPPDEAALAARVNLARQRVGLRRLDRQDPIEDHAEVNQDNRGRAETSDEFRAISRAMVDGLIIVDGPAARVLHANRAMCELTGYAESELIGRSAVDLCPPSARAEMGSLIARAGRPAGFDNVELPLVRKDGSMVPCSVALGRVEYRGRACTAGLFRDLTARKHAEAVLASSEARSRALFEGAALGILLCDRDTRVIECNTTLAAMIGYDCETVLGRRMAEFTHPDDQAESARRFREFLVGECESVGFEKRLVHCGGTVVWCRVTLSFLPEPGSRREHVIGVIENVTDRKIAQQALRESERMLRGLVENLPDLVVVAAADWSIQFMNHQPPGALSTQFVGRSTLSFVPPEDGQELVERRRRLLATREVQQVEVKDVFGTCWAVRMIPFEENGNEPGMLLICTDITEKRSAAEAVAKEQESLRKMLELFERDRELIAFEIHDGFSQQLTGALLHFEAARQAQHRSAEDAQRSFDVGVELLRESIAEARRLVRGLRPPVLDAFGIVPAIEHLIEDHHTVGGGRVEFDTSGVTGRLAPPLESALFRTVQETLNNARKYSRSDRIRIRLSQDARRVSVEIRDWGVGFDPEKVGDDHFGLRGIRERARLLGGTSQIEARTGEGTRICVAFPLVEGVEGDRSEPRP